MRARSRPWIILIALTMLMGSGAVFFPAAWALPLLRPDTGELQFAAVSGWWWKGRAGGVRWRGLHLGNANWELTGLALDSGVRSHWAVSGNGPDYDLAARLEVHGGRLRSTRAVRGVIPANWLAPPAAALLAGLGGRLELDIDRVLLDREGRPVAAHGAARWSDAGLTGLLRADLGDIAIRLEEQDHMTVMTMTPWPRADLRLSGQGLLEGGRYRGQLRFDARDPGHGLLRRLEPLGERQADGSVVLPFAGTFGDDSP